MAVTPVNGWPIPNLTDVADGPDGFSDLALAIESTMSSKALSTYTPSWTGDDVTPANPASRNGWYRAANGVCHYVAQLTFGASTSGGYGYLNIGLPVPAHSAIPRQVCGQVIMLVAGIANNDRQAGYATTGNSAATTASPWFPLGVARTSYGRWRNADSTGNPDTGVPNVDGVNYNIRSGGYIVVQGWYYTA